MHLHLGARRSYETAGAGYQRTPSIQLPVEHDLHVLAAESVADFVAPALVDVSAPFVGP